MPQRQCDSYLLRKIESLLVRVRQQRLMGTVPHSWKVFTVRRGAQRTCYSVPQRMNARSKYRCGSLACSQSILLSDACRSSRAAHRMASTGSELLMLCLFQQVQA